MKRDRDPTPGAKTSGSRAALSASPHGKAIDVVTGARAVRVWGMLGWNDIRQRYRRSVLGPFWITLSMAVLVLALGFLYSRIFKQDIKVYLPYIALGFITWGFISSSTNECCGAFTDSNSIIKQIRVPFSVYVFRVVWRNFIVLMHTIVLIVPIWVLLGIQPSLTSLVALLGLALLFVNQIWIGIVVAVFSTRFRDVPLMVQTALQIGMFATPIMWPIDSLGGHTLVADINPVYHLMELVRAPLMNKEPAALSWIVGLSMAPVGLLLATLLLRKTSRSIVYWL